MKAYVVMAGWHKGTDRSSIAVCSTLAEAHIEWEKLTKATWTTYDWVDIIERLELKVAEV